MYRTFLAATALATATLSMPVATAQQQSTSPQTATSATPSSRAEAGTQSKEQLIALWLATDNHVDAEIAKLAREKAKNDEVKKFAKSICDAHDKAKEKLTSIVPGSSLDLDKEPSTDRQAARPATPATAAGDSHAGRELDASKLRKKIAQRRVEMLKKELKDKEGEEFDTAYLGYQLVQHQNMIAALSVLEDETSGQLQEAVKQGLKAAEEHFEKGRKIMKDLKS